MKIAHEIIKAKRLEKNISQREIARRINVDNATILKIENGKTKKPNIKLIFNICNQLEMKDDEIFEILDLYEYDLKEMLEIGIIANYTTIKGLEKLSKYLNRINENIRVIDIIKVFEDYKKGKLDIEEVFNYIKVATGIDLNQYIYDKK